MNSAEEEARKLLKFHGLEYKVRNPIEHHTEPECGSCHHFDVLNLEAGIAQAIVDAEKYGMEEAAVIAENCDCGKYCCGLMLAEAIRKTAKERKWAVLKLLKKFSI